MISSTEGDIMSKKDEPEYGMAELYWYILSDMYEYQKDYRKLKRSYKKQESWFKHRWSLSKPLDPFADYAIEDIAKCFLIDNKPNIPVVSKIISKDSCTLHLDLKLDLRCGKTKITKEIKKIIDKEIPPVKGKKPRKNLLGEQNTKTTDAYYKSVLFAYLFKKDGDDYGQIRIKGKMIGHEFGSDSSAKHQYEKFLFYEKTFPVPIRT
jgi:hypothetical protein